jgi:FkbM family methyltransferase
MSIKKFIVWTLTAFFKNKYAKKRYYSFFYFLYLQGLKGMDHGNNYIYPKSSGELMVLKKVAEYYEGKGQKVIFFDVGANTGYYAKAVLDIFSNVDVYCFEPSQFTYQQLFAQLGTRVKPFQLALSNKADKVVLHLDKKGSGMATIEDTQFEPPFGISSDLRELIQTDTLDNFLSANKIERVNFLKMDVEGHEYAILEGAMNSLRNDCFDFIQFEFGRVNIDSRTPLKLFYRLLNGKYRIYRIISSGLIPQFEYNYEYEIYMGTNFLAIKKEMDIDLSTL